MSSSYDSSKSIISNVLDTSNNYYCIKTTIEGFYNINLNSHYISSTSEQAGDFSAGFTFTSTPSINGVLGTPITINPVFNPMTTVSPPLFISYITTSTADGNANIGSNILCNGGQQSTQGIASIFYARSRDERADGTYPNYCFIQAVIYLRTDTPIYISSWTINSGGGSLTQTGSFMMNLLQTV